MAVFSWSMQIIGRSAGRSVVAAAAYRAGERLYDERSGQTHDYSRRSGVEHSEILFPKDSPGWALGLDREGLWNAVEAAEKRKDAQTARELRIMIPRELPQDDRITVVRDYLRHSFVDRGMVADVSWHNKTASDGKEQPHAHVLLTLRPLAASGFGPKSRHDMVPDPSGRTHPDGKPVLIESNRDSWNSAKYFERCREHWEVAANAALEKAGSAERIDRRSLLARGLARMPEPALRLAHYLTDLYGCMRDRFGQFQMAKHYRSVEQAAKSAFRTADFAAASPATAANSPKRTVRDAVTPQPGEASHLSARFTAWYERQLERLQPAAPPRQPDRPISPPTQEHGHDR